MKTILILILPVMMLAQSIPVEKDSSESVTRRSFTGFDREIADTINAVDIKGVTVLQIVSGIMGMAIPGSGSVEYMIWTKQGSFHLPWDWLRKPADSVIYTIFLFFTIPVVSIRLSRQQIPLDNYFKYPWTLLLILAVSELISTNLAIWMLAIMCFISLREYYSLLSFKRGDCWGVLGAFISIPFMIYFIQADSYGMFIISIPLYAILVIPLLVTLGGRETHGIISSIGAIDLGLLLYVFCFGHLGYLALLSTSKAAMLILCVALSDITSFYVYRQESLSRKKSAIPRWKKATEYYIISIFLTVLFIWGLSPLTGITGIHVLTLGALIPAAVAVSRHTDLFSQENLKVTVENLCPGRGQTLYYTRPFLYAAPAVFYYIHYFLK